MNAYAQAGILSALPSPMVAPSLPAPVMPPAANAPTTPISLSSNQVEPGSLRDYSAEAATAQAMGGPPTTPQETAQMIQSTYHPSVIAQDPHLSSLVAAGTPSQGVNQQNGLVAPTLPQGAGGQIFNPTALKAAGYTDQQIQAMSGAGGQANAMQGQLNATPKPTNSSLYVLEQALRAKAPIDDTQTDPLYAAAGIPSSGAGAYAALANNLAQHKAELAQKYQSFSGIVTAAGGTMNDAYNNVLTAYGRSVDQYNRLQDQAFQEQQKQQDYENSMKLQITQEKAQAALQQSANEWEVSHRAGQYIAPSADNGYQGGVFNPSTNTFTPNDHSNSVSDGTGYGDTSNPTPVNAQQAQTLGSVSAKYESGGDYSRVSSGVGDAGGVSYGAHQLSGGSIPAFINNSGYADQFKGLTPGTPAFSAKWQQLSKGDPNFNSAQDQYTESKYYQPLTQSLQKSGVDLSQRGNGVQQMIYSTGVQYGAGTKIINAALKGKDVANMSDEQIISTVQNYKAETISSYFKSSSKAVQAGVKNRTMNEMKDLLALSSEDAQLSPAGQTWAGQAVGAVGSAIGGLMKGDPSQMTQGLINAGNSGNNVSPADQIQFLTQKAASATSYQEQHALNMQIAQLQMANPQSSNAPQTPQQIAQQSVQNQPQQQAPQVPAGPTDENGTVLSPQRLQIRSGYADASTIARTQGILNAKAAQNLPGAQANLNQFYADQMYAKQHPPLDPQTIKKYDQALQTLQDNVDTPSQAGMENMMGAIQTLNGSSNGSAQDMLSTYQKNNGLDKLWSSVTGTQDKQIDIPTKKALIQQALNSYQLATGKTVTPITFHGPVTGDMLSGSKNGLITVGEKNPISSSDLGKGEIMVRDNMGNVGALPVGEFDSKLYTKV